MKKTTDYSGKSGLYCQVNPVKGFAPLEKILREALEEEGIKVYDPEDFHCTVMYSREEAPHSIRVIKLLDAAPYTWQGWSDKLDYWPGHDNSGYLVLKLQSRDLMIRNEQYKDLGCKHSFPTYEPHITIADNVGAKPQCMAKLNRMLKSLKFSITFSGEHCEDIRED